MALSGTVKSTSYEGRYIQFDWNASQDITKNTSTIRWTLKGAGDAPSSWYNSAPFYVEINGVKKYHSTTRIPLYNGTSITSGTETIVHDNKGKASFTVTIKAAIYQASYNCEKTQAFTLNTIPRKATITSAPNFSDENNPTISYSNPLGSAVSSLQACIADVNGDEIYVPYRNISKAESGSYTFTLTDAERQTLYLACTNANSMAVKFYIKTVINGVTYFSNVTKTLTIVNANPTITVTAVEHADADGQLNTQVTGSNQRWIKGYSDVAYTITPSLKKGASYKSCTVTCGSQTRNSLTGTFTNVTSGTVNFTLVDSRGNEKKASLNRTLIDYIKPSVSLAVKPDLDTATTAKMTLTFKGQYFSGNLLANSANTLTLQYRYKKDSGSWSSWVSVTPTKGTNSYNLTTIATGFDYLATYTFQAQVQDRHYNIHSQWITSNDVTVNLKPVFSWDKDDFEFNVPVNSTHKDMAYQQIHGTSGAHIAFGVGGGGINRGIFDYTQNKWLVRYDGNNTSIADSTHLYTFGKNKLLWSGGAYMNGNQTIELSEAISAQPHGIVIVFSRYNPTTQEIQSHNFNYHFIPKAMIGSLGNGNYGSSFIMATSNFALVASKYLYFTDTTIKGHESNTAVDTAASGIKYDNNTFVLRYVIGV